MVYSADEFERGMAFLSQARDDASNADKKGAKNNYSYAINIFKNCSQHPQAQQKLDQARNEQARL